MSGGERERHCCGQLMPVFRVIEDHDVELKKCVLLHERSGGRFDEREQRLFATAVDKCGADVR